MYFNHLDLADPAVGAIIKREMSRQENKLEMIASENFASPAVMEACGSALTNKYAEGYPGKRYYGGCEHADEVEALAIERGKALFGAEYANVQPHSGSSANLVVYYALLSQGDTILGMDLSNGGHLTHGSKANMSGKYFNFVSYGIDVNDEKINYEDVLKIAKACRPKLIVAGASAYPRLIEADKFREIADEVGALLMVDMAHFAGLVAGGQHPNPVKHAHIVTSTTHKTLRGPRGGVIFAKKEFEKPLNKGVFPGMQGGPLMHIIAGKAVCFKEATRPEFKEYQKRVRDNARVLARELMNRGFRLVSNGTDNHLVLVNLTNKGVTGKDAEQYLDAANITTNKNTILNDPNGPNVTSGIRLGTPALTTRGFGEAETARVAEAIALVLDRPGDEAQADKARAIVRELCEAFPLYKVRQFDFE
ncbi:MAG: serine hydroxymethyltransferase [Clostridiales Family XIII bacterium]|jgi:glycine hydroxymethyltransferase|nr:serine hydroxymethyltransferase [Clostridiales Family XIII bacterium]